MKKEEGRERKKKCVLLKVENFLLREFDCSKRKKYGEKKGNGNSSGWGCFVVWFENIFTREKNCESVWNRFTFQTDKHQKQPVVKVLFFWKIS